MKTKLIIKVISLRIDYNVIYNNLCITTYQIGVNFNLTMFLNFDQMVKMESNKKLTYVEILTV